MPLSPTPPPPPPPPLLPSPTPTPTPTPQGDEFFPSGILTLSKCRLTPRGIKSVAYHLTSHPLFADVPQAQLSAMAVAFLAHGGSLPQGVVHSTHTKIRSDGQPTWWLSMRHGCIQLVTDLLMWIDSLSGGATLMIHCPGPRAPNTEPVLEDAGLDVFLPLFLLQENPALSPVFARIVKQFSEQVTAVTMDPWDRTKDLHTSLNNPTISRTPSRRGLMHDLIPRSITPHHVFYGRPTGELETLIAQIAPPSRTQSNNLATEPTTRPKGEIDHLSPSSMPHMKIAYETDHSSRLEDALAWAEMSATGTVEHQPNFPQRGGDTEASQVLRALLAHIDTLENALESRDAAIARLRDVLSDDGNETEHETSPTADPLFSNHTVAPAIAYWPNKDKPAASREVSVLSSFSSVSSIASVLSSPSPSQLDKRHSCPTQTPTAVLSSTETTQSVAAITPRYGSTRTMSRIHATSFHASHPSRVSSARLSHSAVPPSPEAPTSSPRPAQALRSFSRPPQTPASPFHLLRALERLSCHPGQTSANDLESCPTQASETMPGTHQVVEPFGRYKHHTIVSRNLLLTTHAVLRRVELECAVSDWSKGIRILIPEISAEIAEELAESMRQDAVFARATRERIEELKQQALLPPFLGSWSPDVLLGSPSSFCLVLEMSAFDSSCPTSFLHHDRGTGTPYHDHTQPIGGEASARRLDEYFDTVEAAVQQVLQFAETTAQLLADTVGSGHDAEHYLRMIFTRGAYLHPLPPAAPQFFAVSMTTEAHLHREFTDEFNRLTGERKRNLLDVLMTQGTPALESLTVRSPPSSRAQDLNNIFEVIKGLVLFLKCRCGVDGFVCLAKNNDACQLRPQWFFSSPNIDRFLSRVVGKWDAGLIGLRLEAFALSGCNIDSLLHTMAPQWYPRWLRHEIRDKIDTLLAQTTGLVDVTMDYDDYEGAILVRFGVALVGWTHETWACPSDLPLDVEPLETLLEAVKTGECYFQQLTAEEHVRCINEYTERLATWPRRECRLRLGRKPLGTRN